MNIPAERWNRVIENRRSRRRFDTKLIELNLIVQIATLRLNLVIRFTYERSDLWRWVMRSVTEKVFPHGEIPPLRVNARVV